MRGESKAESVPEGQSHKVTCEVSGRSVGLTDGPRWISYSVSGERNRGASILKPNGRRWLRGEVAEGSIGKTAFSVTLSANGGSQSIVIQDRELLYRESIRILLSSKASIGTVLAVADRDSLIEACRTNEADVVLFEAASVPWGVCEMLETVQTCFGDVTLVGTYPYEYRRHKVIRGVHYVPRTASCQLLLDAAAGKVGNPTPDFSAGTGHIEGVLSGFTPRDLQVLALMSGGFTIEEMATRLDLSTKTIENRKQALFAKLGVQNESHAVAVAMRSGLLAVGSAP